MPPARSVIVRGKRRVFDGYFKIDELTVSHWQRDGSMSPDKRYLIFERGDSVAALLFNRDTLQAILVSQFRAPVLEHGQGGGWITELMAGTIRPGETPLAAVIREAREETGYHIREPQLIATFFSSPGGSSERVFLYYAEVCNADRFSPGTGVRSEHEDIELVTLSPDALFENLQKGNIEDPKLIIAAYWLKDRLRTVPVVSPPLPPGTTRFVIENNPNQVLGYKTGPILKVTGVDAWVNSESTDMTMDRVSGGTVSANIRYGGADKDSGGNPIADTVADALRSQLGRRRFVPLGTVVHTAPGALAATHGVRRLFHVATVDGSATCERTQAHLGRITDYARQAILAVHRWNEGSRSSGSVWAKTWGKLRGSIWGAGDGPCTSLLLPLLGAGSGGLTAEEAAPRLVAAALEFFEEHPEASLKEIYLLAYTARERDACDAALTRSGKVRRARANGRR